MRDPKKGTDVQQSILLEAVMAQAEKELHVQCGRRGTVNVTSWECLARVQITQRNDCEVSHGEVTVDRLPLLQPVAFYDRNCFTEPWRKIILVRDGDNVLVYNGTNGELIDEPAEGVSAGSTPLMGDEMTLLSDWEFGYYALPHGDDLSPPADKKEQQEQQELFVYDAKCVKGARIAICYGVPPDPSVWYGATIDEVDVVKQALLLAFDDGELSWRTAAELKDDAAAGCFKFLASDHGGLRDGMEGKGVPAAVRAARQKDGRSPEARPVGVLMGDTGFSICGEPLYMAFYRDAAAVQKAEQETSSSRSTRTTEKTDHVTFQDRYGLHTFVRGNIVKYQHLQEGETAAATVFAVSWPESDAGAKYLVLEEASSKAYFVSRYTDWTREHTVENADPDDCETAKSVSLEHISTMAEAFEACEHMSGLRTKAMLVTAATHVHRFGPPHLESQRKQSSREERDKEKGSKKEARVQKGKERVAKRKVTRTHPTHASHARTAARTRACSCSCALVCVCARRPNWRQRRPKVHLHLHRPPQSKTSD